MLMPKDYIELVEMAGRRYNLVLHKGSSKSLLNVVSGNPISWDNENGGDVKYDYFSLGVWDCSRNTFGEIEGIDIKDFVRLERVLFRIAKNTACERARTYHLPVYYSYGKHANLLYKPDINP